MPLNVVKISNTLSKYNTHQGICEAEREMKFDFLLSLCAPSSFLTGVALEQGSFTKIHSQNTKQYCCRNSC